MQAIILAAGVGKRLQPLTNGLPKALITINGKPLIANMLDHLAGRNIGEVIIVVGHHKDQIIAAIGTRYQGLSIRYIENPLYSSTNNVYSLWLAKDAIREDTILLECDLFFKRELIDKILSASADCCILVSPYDRKTMSGTVVSADSDLRARSLIINRHQDLKHDYSQMMKTVNIYTFSKDFIINKFIPAIDLYVRTQCRKSFYELVLGSLIYYGNDNIRVLPVGKEHWCEIDTSADLERARGMADRISLS